MPEIVLSDVSRAELRERGWRTLKDRLFGGMMAIGGIMVILAILLIFVYLLYVVFPLFKGIRLTPGASFSLGAGAVAHLSLNEYADVGFAIRDDGSYVFFRTADGTSVQTGELATAGNSLAAIRGGYRAHGTVALALDDGSALLVRPSYQVSFPNDRRQVTPSLAYPVGEAPVQVSPAGSAIALIAAESGAAESTVVAWTDQQGLYLTHLAMRESLLEETAEFEKTQVRIPVTDEDIIHLALDVDQKELYVISGRGHVSFFDIRDKSQPKLVEDVQVVPPGVQVSTAEFLSGGISLLVGDTRGRIAQWFPVRDADNNYRLTKIREFRALAKPILHIEPEYFRKGFAAIDAAGDFALFHTTADRTLLVAPALGVGTQALAISPRADALAVAGTDDEVQIFRVQNEHPEVSWRSLWGKVWYEGRSQPEFIWQSSSASSDFEPKMSLTPLTFGTLKAALYAMAFAIPIAILGAIYTAYFMHPRVRTLVKPSIEIMAALPTVILGFLAGLWLAPLIESHLIGVFAALLFMPPAVILAAYLWSRLPDSVQSRVQAGMEVLLLVPVLCGVLWFAMSISQPLEELWFDGNLPRWLSSELGLSFDQRNSLVVGIAMGFAIIPNIFSISEDAVFGVPRHLTTGSLALGATPWQTVTRVVLLTASPGIFSAVMIGLGRAVGETMIVLMATGNTPVMDFNIFQGFRALSANIAVEMPESEVNSTHYRVLFLAALVLFAVTFVFNTVAEVVRQRLRAKYSNL